MNDDELGRRLQNELHRRIDAPDEAPEPLYQHLENLRSMQEMRWAGARGGPHLARDLFGLAAVVAIAALVVAGLWMRQSNPPNAGFQTLKYGIEAFGRIDSQTAWAESGPDLYITRDGGETWSHGTVPGGMSPGQMFSGMSTVQATPVEAPTFPPNAPEETVAPASGESSSYASFLNHFYPDFIDADHGWLVSWIESGPDSDPSFTITVWRTNDGGQTWQSVQVPGKYRGYGLIQFVDASHGWVTILRNSFAATETSGASSDAQPSSGMPSDMTTILTTADGGATWTTISTLSSRAVLHFVSVTEAWGYGYTYTTADTGLDEIIHTTDGGRTWTTALLSVPTGCYLFDWSNPPEVVSGSVTVQMGCQQWSATTSGGSTVTGTSEILTFGSADGGRTWRLVSTGPTNPVAAAGSIISGSPLLSLPQGQPVALTVTDAASSAAAGFQVTFDGGATWATYSTAGLPSAAALAEWTSPDDAWVMTGTWAFGAYYGLGGQLYATHDAGKTWKALLGTPTWPASPAPSTSS